MLYDNKNDYDFTMECDEIIALEVGARSGENDKGYPGVRETCLFLSEYAVQLFGSGCTCIRLEKNMKRIAASLGMNVEFSVLPRHIHITVSKGDSDFTSVIGIRDLPISFSRITDLSRLSWQMADGKIDFLTARSVLPRICNCACVNPWLLLLLVSLANASFCRLFSGDPMAMATVFIATFIGFLVKQILVRCHMDIRLTVLFCSFLSAMIAAAGSLLGIGGDARDRRGDQRALSCAGNSVYKFVLRSVRPSLFMCVRTCDERCHVVMLSFSRVMCGDGCHAYGYVLRTSGNLCLYGS